MRLSRLFASGCAIAALTPVLLPAGQAAAAVGERVVYVADRGGSGDGLLGLYTTTNFGDTPSTVIAENGVLDVSGAKVSPNGTQIAALVDSAGNGDYALQVMNVDGAHRRTVLAATHNVSTGAARIVTGFSWDPSSAAIVFGQLDFIPPSTVSFKLRSYNVGTGAVVDIQNSAGLADPAVAPDGTIAAVDNSSGALVVLNSTTGTRTATGVASGSSDFVGSPAWSADGSKLIYVDDISNNADTSTINVISLAGSTWSAPTVVAPSSDGTNTWFNENPTFDSDGTIWFDRYDDSTNLGAPQDIVTATFNGTTWTLNSHSTPSVDDGSITFGAIDATAPVAPTLQAFTLAGTTTYLNWTTTDVDVSKINVHRTGSDGSSTNFAATTTHFADKTTKLGVTYTYTATATDGGGLTGPSSAPRSVTAAAVKIAVSNPTSLGAAKLPFVVSWGVAGNKSVTYAVVYAPVGGATRTFQSATSAAKATFGSVSAGQTYAFRALVKDTYGNSSAWTGWSKAVVPFDQSKGTFSRSPSWSTAHSTADWLGSIKTTTHNKATVAFKLTSRGVQIIGDKFPKGAKFAVYVGKTYKGTFSTRAATTKHRQVLYSANFSTLAARTIKVVAVVASGKTLRIDGVAAPK